MSQRTIAVRAYFLRAVDHRLSANVFAIFPTWLSPTCTHQAFPHKYFSVCMCMCECVFAYIFHISVTNRCFSLTLSFPIVTCHTIFATHTHTHSRPFRVNTSKCLKQRVSRSPYGSPCYHRYLDANIHRIHVDQLQLTEMRATNKHERVNGLRMMLLDHDGGDGGGDGLGIH